LENDENIMEMTSPKGDENGFLLDGEVRRIKTIRLSNNSKIYLVAQNQNTLLAFARTQQ